MKNSVQEADAVICPFPRTYYMLERALDIALKNLFLTPEILITQTFIPEQIQVAASLSKFGLTGTWSKFLFYPAQLQKHKGHESILQVLNDKRVSDVGVKVVFCGSDSDVNYTNYLKRLVQEAGVSEKCRFLGRVSEADLSALFSSCTGVIVPSRAEGGALVALEGIFFNKPITVNRIEAAVMHLQMYQAKCHWFNVDDRESVIEALLVTWQIGGALEHSFDNSQARELFVDRSKEALVVEGWTKVIYYLCGGESKPFPCVDSNLNVFRYV